MADLETIVASFPRIWKLRGKKILIKFGGSAFNGNGDLERFSSDIALLVSLGLRPIVVHGGGPDITKEMERRGMEVRKVGGLRITDDQGLQVVKEVLSNINSTIVSSLRSSGIKATGLSGAEEGSITCRKLPPVKVYEDGVEREIDLGHVGEVESIDPTFISLLCASGFVPVIYPICRDKEGREMNVNADTVAAHLAHVLGCEEMVMVTDVPGILRKSGDEDTLIGQVTLSDLDSLIGSGVVTGGMLPKVEACRLAITNGVKEAHMVSGKVPHSILDQLLKGTNCGTTFTVS